MLGTYSNEKKMEIYPYAGFTRVDFGRTAKIYRLNRNSINPQVTKIAS